LRVPVAAVQMFGRALDPVLVVKARQGIGPVRTRSQVVGVGQPAMGRIERPTAWVTFISPGTAKRGLW